MVMVMTADTVFEAVLGAKIPLGKQFSNCVL